MFGLQESGHRIHHPFALWVEWGSQKSLPLTIMRAALAIATVGFRQLTLGRAGWKLCFA
jgi:hypothetical protein